MRLRRRGQIGRWAILSVLPLLLASGGGASARKSLGLAVLFVPAFFVVIRGWADRRAAARTATTPS